VPLSDWFLTDEERGKPGLLDTHLGAGGNTANRLFTVKNVFQPVGGRSGNSPGGVIHSSSPTGGATATRRMRERRPDHRGALRGPRPSAVSLVKGLLWRSHADKLSYRRAREPRPERRRSGRAGGRGAASTRRVPARRLAPPEAGRDSATGVSPSGTSPSAGGIDLCHSRRRRRRPPRRPPSRFAMSRGSTGPEIRPGTTLQLALRGPGWWGGARAEPSGSAGATPDDNRSSTARFSTVMDKVRHRRTSAGRPAAAATGPTRPSAGNAAHPGAEGPTRR